MHHLQVRRGEGQSRLVSWHPSIPSTHVLLERAVGTKPFNFSTGTVCQYVHTLYGKP
jgi:hypothetical protein